MVKYIEYQEKKYPVRISYYAMKMFQKDTGRNISDLSESEDIFTEGLYEKLLYYALVAGARVEQTELELKEEQMEMVLDECFMEFINLIPAFFPEIEQKGGQAVQNKPAGKKKK